MAMIFCHLNECKSIRDLAIRFNSKAQNHYHLGVKEIKRSTLSNANQSRKSDVFKDIANNMIQRSKAIHELGSVLKLLDSSTIRVACRGSSWTEATETCRGKGLKLHVQCSGDGKSIELASITNTNVNDITEAKNFTLESNKIYVFDKGYVDFDWWHKIANIKSFFVTRIKTNTAHKVTKERDISKCDKSIISDKEIELINKSPRGGKKNLLAGKKLRIVELYDKEHDKTYKFITNIIDKSAEEIGGYYKSRWGIELLFKWLKQNLKLKKFICESENAIKIQIYTAIITYILIGMYKANCMIKFDRMIDLMSWIKIMICSRKTELIRREKKPDKTNQYQLSFEQQLI